MGLFTPVKWQISAQNAIISFNNQAKVLPHH